MNILRPALLGSNFLLSLLWFLSDAAFADRARGQWHKAAAMTRRANAALSSSQQKPAFLSNIQTKKAHVFTLSMKEILEKCAKEESL